MSAAYAQLGHSAAHHASGQQPAAGGGGKGGLEYLPRDSVSGCMALCEIVDTGGEVVQTVVQERMHSGKQNVTESLGSIKRVGQEWVVPDEDYIVTRFLFVFVRQSGCTANTETAAFVAEAEKAMAAGTH